MFLVLPIPQNSPGDQACFFLFLVTFDVVYTTSEIAVHGIIGKDKLMYNKKVYTRHENFSTDKNYCMVIAQFIQ